MPVINFVATLLTCESNFLSINNDNIVAVINMRRICRKVLTAETHSNECSKAANNDILGINQNPFLLNLSGFYEFCGFHNILYEVCLDETFKQASFVMAGNYRSAA